VFCPKCGAQNADGAVFCSNCGSKLSELTPMGVGPAAPSRPIQGKSPLVAAILNLFFGAGYLYMGYNKVLGVPTLVFVLIALIFYIILGVFTVGLLPLIVAIVLAVDGWQKADGQKGFISAE
jgi:hypothetical protein